jgi:hypothetical protein
MPPDTSGYRNDYLEQEEGKRLRLRWGPRETQMNNVWRGYLLPCCDRKYVGTKIKRAL